MSWMCTEALKVATRDGQMDVFVKASEVTEGRRARSAETQVELFLDTPPSAAQDGQEWGKETSARSGCSR